MAQKCRAERRAAERTEKKQRKQEGNVKGREYLDKKNGSDMMRTIENIMMIMGENDLEDRGSFMAEVMAFAERQEENAKLAEIMKRAFIGVGEDDARVQMTDEMKNAIAAASKPMQIMLDHAKDGVSIEEYFTWSTPRLSDFLQEHKLKPAYPMPPRQVFVALAKEMQGFVMVCMTIIDSAPEQSCRLGCTVAGIRGVQEFMGGMKRGTLFQAIKPKNLEGFELLVELLRENRRGLDAQQNTSTQLLENHCTSKSSVICPADPNRKGGCIKYCQLCWPTRHVLVARSQRIVVASVKDRTGRLTKSLAIQRGRKYKWFFHRGEKPDIFI